MRSLQALLGLPKRPTTSSKKAGAARLGRAHNQLYVDDHALVAAGTPDQVQCTFDLALIWFLVLGVPVAWAKGERSALEEEHT